MQISSALEADLESVAQVWFDRLALLQQTDPLIRLSSDALERWRARAQTWIANEEYAFFLARDADAVRGYIVITTRDGPAGLEPQRLGTVVEMAVDLHQAHSGLSRQLLARAKVWLQARGVNCLETAAPARYPVEEAFWRGQGARLSSQTFWLEI